eukprot:gnl/TRDRNA2_/TRDRNA2_167840_c1_seq2.p1 gnl/TRDRNA2_/TRDRNA2_167840_c1~~gnl/TRDRNA2_/TRDRNA2_167840_c1_seq2.p1  ORF type:complete len:159 (+),score=20.79 gnl/TRDRNA2_/TRDRNA2_167840_c1_seq2:138-614(+)
MQECLQFFSQSLQIALSQDHLRAGEGTSAALFNIFGYSANVLPWCDGFQEVTPENISSAVSFIRGLEPGAGPDMCLALEAAFEHQDVEAIHLVTDGRMHLDEEFLRRAKIAFYNHPKRPKLHTVLINCEPNGEPWKYMKAMALLTKSSFRPVCFDLGS